MTVAIQAGCRKGAALISLSLCMIVRDEEKVLGRCLASVKGLADEVVIVDTGSADRTKEIAAQYTDRIYDFVWEDDFSAARNFAFQKGTCDYLMWLDADDVIPEREARKFLELKRTLPKDADVVMMPYATAFDEQGRSTFTYYRERIVRNRAGYLFRGRVHEVIPPTGTVVYSDVCVEHWKSGTGDGVRNLRIYEGMERRGEPFDARALYYYGRELLFHRRYEKAAEILERFLHRPDGWVENRIDAARQLSRCYAAMGEKERALESLLHTFAYDVPRGEVCCDLAGCFQEQERYDLAIFWYRQALHAEKKPETGAFVEEDCYGFLPALGLCVCCDRLGRYEEAAGYNELAGTYRPQSPYYLSNVEYFREMGVQAESFPAL